MEPINLNTKRTEKVHGETIAAVNKAFEELKGQMAAAGVNPYILMGALPGGHPVVYREISGDAEAIEMIAKSFMVKPELLVLTLCGIMTTLKYLNYSTEEIEGLFSDSQSQDHGEKLVAWIRDMRKRTDEKWQPDTT